MAAPARRPRGDILGIIALAVVIALLPLVLSGYRVSILVFIGIDAIIVMGLCLLMGYAGQVSLGHAAFYALGAYASGLLTVRLAINPWLAMLLAALFTGAVAYLIGIPILRLRGNYLAMATLGLGIIVYVAAKELSFTGGPSGFSGVPALAIGPLVFNSDLSFYALVWVLVLVALVLSLNIVNSRVGRALRAIHTSEVAATSLGVNATRHKLQIFVVSAVYASVAGSLYAHYVKFVNPDPFGFTFSVELVVMAVIGGLASVWGAVFGATLVFLLSTLMRDLIPKLLPNAGGEQEIIAFGILLVAVMIFMPDGLTRGVPALFRGAARRLRRARGELPGEEALVLEAGQ